MRGDWTDPCTTDRLTALVELALGQARRSRAAILDTVQPVLPPARRLSAERMMRLIETGRIFRSVVLDELEALIRQVEAEIAAGTTNAFRANECDPRQGYVEPVQDDRATALRPALEDLRLLHRRITGVIDAVEAQRVAAALVDPD